MKKHTTVIAAEALAGEKAKELAVARELVKRLEQEYSAALAAMKQAQVVADGALPQCRLVRAHWRSGKEEDAGSVVILRKTPGGMLIARRVGEASGVEFRFKWQEYSAKYVEAKKRDSFTYERFELRDVPADYSGLPKAV